MGPFNTAAGRTLTGHHCAGCKCLPPRTQWLIDRKYELSGFPLSDAQRAELTLINEELDEVGLRGHRRDPIVELFLAELHARRKRLVESARDGSMPHDKIAHMVGVLFDERLTEGL